jgi:hypothetical protein
MAKAYGLVRSTWDPSKSIDVLFKEVKEHGVIGFGGTFGRDYYLKDSHVVRQSNGRDIYGWSQGERKEESLCFASVHYIGVVGVTKPTTATGQACVIYVDPEDGTDPQNSAQQKFYMISYASFMKNLFDEYGIGYNPKSFPVMHETFLQRGVSHSFGLLPNPSYFKK